MSIWTWPLIGAIVIIGSISFIATRRIMTLETRRAQNNDTPVSQAVKDHPYTMNPIFWVYAVALIFISLVILFYATTTTYK